MNTLFKIFAFSHSAMFAINAQETVLIANDLPQNEFFTFERDVHYDVSRIIPKKDSYSDGRVVIKFLGTSVAPKAFSNLRTTKKGELVDYSDSFVLSLKFEKSGNQFVRFPIDCEDMFCDSPMSEIDLSGIDSSAYITNMKGMFCCCERLSSLDLSNLNTSEVTDMSCMFDGCDNLKDIKLQNFDTSNVTNMSGMFSQTGLETLDLSHFDTKNVTDMNSMFLKSGVLKTLNVKNFNTSKVTDMSEMFYSCGELSSLDLSSFDTRNVQKMYKMFWGNYKLQWITLGKGCHSGLFSASMATGKKVRCIF